MVQLTEQKKLTAETLRNQRGGATTKRISRKGAKIRKGAKQKFFQKNEKLLTCYGEVTQRECESFTPSQRQGRSRGKPNSRFKARRDEPVL
jgi:hypothetical protein